MSTAPATPALTPAQRALILGAPPASKVRIPAAAWRTVGVLKRKGLVEVTHRHTSNGYLHYMALTNEGFRVQRALRKAATA